RGRRRLDRDPNAALHPAGVTGCGADQVEEVALDPLPGEVVRHGDHEDVALDARAAHLTEPGLEGRVVQGFSQPSRDVLPDSSRRQPDLLLHACRTLLRSRVTGARAYQRPAGVSMRISRPVHRRGKGTFAGIYSLLHMLSTAVERAVRKGAGE